AVLVGVDFVKVFGQRRAFQLFASETAVGVLIEIIEFGTAPLQGSKPATFAALIGDEPRGRTTQLFFIQVAIFVGVELIKELGDLTLGLGLADLAVLIGVHLFEELFYHALDLRIFIGGIVIRVLVRTWFRLFVVAEPLTHRLMQPLNLLFVELAIVIGVDAIEDLGQARRHFVLRKNAVVIFVEALDEVVRA